MSSRARYPAHHSRTMQPLWIIAPPAYGWHHTDEYKEQP